LQRVKSLQLRLTLAGSPFLSDIELGRRFPFEEILAKLAKALNVSLEDLKQYDNGEPIADLKRLMDSDRKLGPASEVPQVLQIG
jgi:transcriptional regulator with XRE-family HTH domain